MKKYFIFTIIALHFFMGIKKCNKCDCAKNYNRKIITEYSCGILPGYIYNRLNYFCDCRYYWSHISLLIKNKKRHNKTLVPDYYWGTKILLCGDNGEYSDLNDPEVFLYIEQDTTKSIYDGALAKISFGSDVIYLQKKELYDIGEKHRIIKFDSSEVSLNYSSSNEEIDIDILKEFQHSITYDSIYIKKYNRVKYNLIYQKNNKCLVSIRYEEYGKRFYFDVYE